jgi:hypothetical protein
MTRIFIAIKSSFLPLYERGRKGEAVNHSYFIASTSPAKFQISNNIKTVKNPPARPVALL